MIREMEMANHNARKQGRPLPYNSYTFPQFGVKFENDESLAVTPERSGVFVGFPHIRTYPGELTSPRVLDDEELLDKVTSLLKETFKHSNSKLEAILVG